MTDDDPIIVFDGVCNFCSSTVRFILKHDRTHRIRLAPLQSKAGAALYKSHGLDPDDAETLLLVKGGQAFVRSDAALEVATDLGPWRWLRLFRVVPRPVRDWLYAILARNRYRWFGRRDSCFAPTPEQRARFLED